jgi:RNA polymerase sigma-70 factor (ECF subfamily)
MSETVSFADFINRIRAGDDRAAEELVRKYETAIRLEIRSRLSDSRLARLVDSMDICQSVLASFFTRAAIGQYDLQSPEQLRSLLVAMARRKLAFQARRHTAQRRDQGREHHSTDADAPDAGPGPSQQVEAQELLREFRRRLSAEERQIADLRWQGCSWDEVASQMGGSAEARRKELSRAADRVAEELGLEMK